MTQGKPIFHKAWTAAGSMRLFFFLSVLIAAWFALLLVMYPKYIVQIYGMNDYVVLDWVLNNKDPGADPIRAWVVILGIMMVALLVNLFVCVVEDIRMLFRLITKKASMRVIMGRLSILLMHAAYITILAGHFLTACTGFKITFTPEENGVYTFEKVPYQIEVGAMKTGPDFRKKGAVNVKKIDITMKNKNGGADKFPLKVKQTLSRSGYLVTLNMAKEGITGCPDPDSGLLLCNPPEIRITKNNGLPVTMLGALLFFPGIILRVMFRSGGDKKK